MSGHWLPAILSFFIPGLGQLLKGDFLKAVFFCVAALITSGVSALVFGLGWILYPVIAVWAIIDAYN
jgi:TM2 domain-containing membrane protein YozV